LRAFLAGIEREVNVGNLNSLERLLFEISEVSAQISNDTLRNSNVGEMSVTLRPNLSEIEPKNFDGSKSANLNFISRLLDFKREHYK
jgi:hypothetical protein